jgi:hypothetical protein
MFRFHSSATTYVVLFTSYTGSPICEGGSRCGTASGRQRHVQVVLLDNVPLEVCWLVGDEKRQRSGGCLACKRGRQRWRMEVSRVSDETRERTERLLVCFPMTYPSFFPDPWPRCFCGSTPDPKLSHLATPHSCGGPCSRTRGCGHPCTLSCHPGPCPPCQVKLELRCHCGRRPLPFKCFHLAKDSSGTSGTADLSCGGICGKMLGCGTHSCQEVCHPGGCEPCRVTEVGKCYCGRVERELRCGEGEAVECSLNRDAEGSLQTWIGMFSCDNKCNR